MTERSDTNAAYAELERIYRAAQGASRLAGMQKPEVAQTPREEIWRLNKAVLYRYTPRRPAEERHRIPVLLVFALINRPYIFDLRPGNSFVEFMVDSGYDIYLIDWGTPGPEDRNLDFGNYALDYLPRAIRQVQLVSGSRDFTLLGWCIGATLSTIYAACRPDDGLKNLVLLTAPLDFSDRNAGPFNKWLDERYFDVDALLNLTGNMPGEMIDWGNKMLKPVENFIGSYLRLWDRIDDEAMVESWRAMNYWVSDLVPMAGAAFRQWVVEFYRENRLMNGTLVARGERVDLSRIRANLLNVIATADHIVPNSQSTTIMDRVGSTDRELLTIPGGHIGLMAGSAAKRRTWPRIEAWLAARSD